MLKTKTTFNLSILRIIAVVAIVSLSFEITSFFDLSDNIQMEIVDIDFDDDKEVDDENQELDLIASAEYLDIEAAQDNGFLTDFVQLSNQHLEELPSPPPDQA